MTVRYDCDGPDCARRMDRSAPRLAITVEEGEKPLMRTWDPDDDDELPEVSIETLDFYNDGDFHFCSDSCLTSWAMARALDQSSTE